MPNFNIASQDKWIPVKLWRKQNIARIVKTVSDLPNTFSESVFKIILNKLKKMRGQHLSHYSKRSE